MVYQNQTLAQLEASPLSCAPEPGANPSIAYSQLQLVLKNYPQIQPIWLPTYAPWLNPIEKLWRWLKESILKMHPLAGDWNALRNRVNSFLNQFSRGSRTLLRYTGLLGDGQLAQAMHPP